MNKSNNLEKLYNVIETYQIAITIAITTIVNHLLYIAAINLFLRCAPLIKSE